MSHIDSLKHQLYHRLDFNHSQKESTEQELSSIPLPSVSSGLSLGKFVILAAAILISSSTPALCNLSPFLWIWIAIDLYLKYTYQSRLGQAVIEYEKMKADVLAHALSDWLAEVFFKRLDAKLGQLDLKSLRESEIGINYSVRFDELKYSKRLSFGSSSYLLAPWKKPFNSNLHHSWHYASEEWLQLVPGVSFSVGEILLNLKCDFRVVRKHLTQDDVSKLFKLTFDHVPFANPATVSVRQWSSTKNFVFDSSYLDANTIKYVNERRQYQRDSAKVLSTYPVINPGSYSPARTTGFKSTFSGWTSSPSSKVRSHPPTIKEIQEKRAQSEDFAMDAAIRFERMRGRTPEDVSALCLGYDIRSVDSEGACRLIEVKGKSGTGEVQLTENEVKTALDHPQYYFVYVVDNCSSEDGNQTLYIKPGLSMDELTQRPVAYEFSLESVEKMSEPIVI